MATNRIEEYRGVVLDRIPQKEHDAMIRALGEKGFFSFYARGALKMGSSSSSCTQELALSDFNLVVSSQGAMTLKEGRLQKLYEPQGGLEGMLVASMLLEYSRKAVHEEDGPAHYPLLCSCLEALGQGKDPWTIAIMFLSKSLVRCGLGFEVDHCVVCGSKENIVAMDPVHGGFLCEECFNKVTTVPACGSTALKVYRHAFRCPEQDLFRVKYPKGECRDVLILLLRYIQDEQGIRLRSLEPILKY